MTAIYITVWLLYVSQTGHNGGDFVVPNLATQDACVKLKEVIAPNRSKCLPYEAVVGVAR